MKSVRIVRDTHNPGGRLVAGETVELPDGLADALVADGRAEQPKSEKRAKRKGSDEPPVEKR